MADVATSDVAVDVVGAATDEPESSEKTIDVATEPDSSTAGVRHEGDSEATKEVTKGRLRVCRP